MNNLSVKVLHYKSKWSIDLDLDKFQKLVNLEKLTLSIKMPVLNLRNFKFNSFIHLKELTLETEHLDTSIPASSNLCNILSEANQIERFNYRITITKNHTYILKDILSSFGKLNMAKISI